MHDSLILVTLTGPTEGQLAELCKVLIGDRLAACANIVPKIRSIYRWAGQVQEEHEVLAILHTTIGAFEPLVARVEEMHPYDVPQIVATDLLASDSYGR